MAARIVGRGRAHARARNARARRREAVPPPKKKRGSLGRAAPRTRRRCRGSRSVEPIAVFFRRAVVAVGRRPPPPLRSAARRTCARVATQAGATPRATAGLVRRVGDDGRSCRRRERGGVGPAAGGRGRPAVDGGAPARRTRRGGGATRAKNPSPATWQRRARSEDRATARGGARPVGCAGLWRDFECPARVTLRA